VSRLLDRLAKVKIERHLRELEPKGLSWTILRPGFFMENFDNTIGSIAVGVLQAGLQPTTTLELIAVSDIGYVAAGVFQSPEVYASQVLVIVGDILTTQELGDAYKEATGRAIPSIPRVLARILITLNRHTQGLIADIERVHQMRIDPENTDNATQIAAARRAHPTMKTFSTWASQKRQKDPKREDNWNQLSISRMVTGKQ